MNMKVFIAKAHDSKTGPNFNLMLFQHLHSSHGAMAEAETKTIYFSALPRISSIGLDHSSSLKVIQKLILHSGGIPCAAKASWCREV